MPPHTRPCPNCAKPIRKEAINCWFCGDVFDTVRCLECGSPVKIGSPACQICGAVAPEPPPPRPATAPSGKPPTAKRADEQDCPACGGPVPLAAIQCKHCGGQLQGPVRKQIGSRAGCTVQRHRGGSLIAAGVISFLFPVLAFVPLAFAFTFGGGPLWLVGFGFLGIGLFLSTSALVMAFLDLKAMGLGHKNPDGWGSTLTGGVLSGVSVLLHWYMIGYYVFAML